MKWLHGELKRALKSGYRTAVTEAKNAGNKATMHVDGFVTVMGILGIQKTMEMGRDQNGSEYCKVEYVHEDVSYVLRSLKRDDRCILTAENGLLEHKIAEVARGTTKP